MLASKDACADSLCDFIEMCVINYNGMYIFSNSVFNLNWQNMDTKQNQNGKKIVQVYNLNSHCVYVKVCLMGKNC